jgi:hypothetical protein
MPHAPHVCHQKAFVCRCPWSQSPVGGQEYRAAFALFGSLCITQTIGYMERPARSLPLEWEQQRLHRASRVTTGNPLSCSHTHPLS